MNQQPREQYIEWMSLAQDGMLDRSQSQLLHQHIADCSQCRLTWEAMNEISRMFRSAPMLEPEIGFVRRFEMRLVYREEQHRRAMIWALLGIGVIALTILALPSLIGALSFTGTLVLPYHVVAYVQGLMNWIYIVVSEFLEAAWLLIRYVCTGPAAPVCVALAATAAAAVAMWTKFLVGRLSGQRVAG
jgi:predicted anti-sigma-YlaC factor YlaD